MPYKDPIKHKEYQKNYQAKWRINNREKVRAGYRKYYYLHQDEILKTKTKQRRKREQSSQVRSRRYHREKIAVFKKYSNSTNPVCICCGESKYEFLTIDHIIPKKGFYKDSAGEGLYRRLLKIPLDKKTYQILCYNCNMGKRINEHCPHKESLFETINEWENWSRLLVIKTPENIKKLWKRKER